MEEGVRPGGGLRRAVDPPLPTWFLLLRVGGKCRCKHLLCGCAHRRSAA